MTPLLLSIVLLFSDPNLIGPPAPLTADKDIIRLASLADFSRNFLKRSEVIRINTGSEIKTHVYYNPWDLDRDGIVNLKDWNLMQKGGEE